STVVVGRRSGATAAEVTPAAYARIPAGDMATAPSFANVSRSVAALCDRSSSVGPVDDTDPTETSRGAAAFAGVVGAGVALGTGELVSAVLGAVPSPLLAVGGRFVDRFAASLKE